MKIVAEKIESDTKSEEDFDRFIRNMNVTHSTRWLRVITQIILHGIPSGIDVVPNPYDKAPGSGGAACRRQNENNDPDNLGGGKGANSWRGSKRSGEQPSLVTGNEHACRYTEQVAAKTGDFFTPEIQ